MKTGDKYKIDTYRVSQYEETRIVDTVEIIESPTKFSKKIVVYSPYLKANVLVYRNDLKPIVQPLTNTVKRDIRKRFKTWLNYEPVISETDVNESDIDEYVTNVMTIEYFEKTELIRDYLYELYNLEKFNK